MVQPKEGPRWHRAPSSTLSDDIDGGDADETVTLAFNGTQCDVDCPRRTSTGWSTPAASVFSMSRLERY